MLVEVAMVSILTSERDGGGGGENKLQSLGKRHEDTYHRSETALRYLQLARNSTHVASSCTCCLRLLPSLFCSSADTRKQWLMSHTSSKLPTMTRKSNTSVCLGKNKSLN